MKKQRTCTFSTILSSQTVWNIHRDTNIQKCGVEEMGYQAISFGTCYNTTYRSKIEENNCDIHGNQRQLQKGSGRALSRRIISNIKIYVVGYFFR